MAENIFKAKSDKEIEDILSDMSVEELLQTGTDLNNKNIVKFAIEKADTKVWAFDYDIKHIDLSNPINLSSFYEILNFDDYRVYIKRISNNANGEYSLNFFGSRFTPMYPDDQVLKATVQTANKIMKTF